MTKLNLSSIPVRKSTVYPAPYAKICDGREKQALGDAGGLTQFGVNLTRLKPGAGSAHRHWHATEDEMVFVVSGNPTLITDEGETVLSAGDVATFPFGQAVGHHLVNRTNEECTLLEIGARLPSDEVTYTDPDVDMHLKRENGGDWEVNRKNGERY